MATRSLADIVRIKILRQLEAQRVEYDRLVRDACIAVDRVNMRKVG